MCLANLSNMFIKLTKALRSIFTWDGCPQIPKSFGIKISDVNGRQLYEIRLPNLLVVSISLARKATSGCSLLEYRSTVFIELFYHHRETEYLFTFAHTKDWTLKDSGTCLDRHFRHFWSWSKASNRRYPGVCFHLCRRKTGSPVLLSDWFI